MNTKMTMLLAGACLVLAGCGGGGGGGGGGGAPPPELVAPLGLEFDVEVSVFSADQRPGASAFVGDDLATVTLNDLNFDADGNLLTFSITLGLPNGGSVTLDETSAISDDTFLGSIADVGFGFARLETVGGDVVDVIVGFDLDALGDLDSTAEAAFAGPGLFVMAIVDELEEDPVFGFNTYLVAGDETETLPTGSANYEGITVASVYNNDALVFEDFVGSVFVEASFDSSLVDIALDGASVASPSTTYTLAGTDLAIVGSQYDGPITGTGIGIPVTGDLFGAFYGPDAEATAGVFGAEGSADGDNIDIVGAFGAAAVLFVP